LTASDARARIQLIEGNSRDARVSTSDLIDFRIIYTWCSVGCKVIEMLRMNSGLCVLKPRLHLIGCSSALVRFYSVSANSIQFTTAVLEKVDLHPNADSLYVSNANIGEGQFRTVCSGLVNFVPLHELIGRRVVLVTNLKSSKLRGVVSEAMVLAAEGSKLELVDPPRNARVGECLRFEGISGEPASSVKLKLWQTVQKNLAVNQRGEIVYCGDYGEKRLIDSSGDSCTVATLTSGTVS
jgi:aminoacyl tRNA synthase complex-interacting multifunctional protein 1